MEVSDSGRIRNELQTVVSRALEHLGDGAVRVRFDPIEGVVLPAGRRARVRDALLWYKRDHPVWFRWLEAA